MKSLPLPIDGILIIDEVEHISPNVVFDDSPLSYLPDRKYSKHDIQASLHSVDSSVQNVDFSSYHYVITIGGRLVGKIDCSDQ